MSDDILKITAEKLDFEQIFYAFIGTYLNYENEHFKITGKEYESKIDDYRDTDEEEKENYINEKLGHLPVHDLKKN